jgi:hypothetical protein
MCSPSPLALPLHPCLALPLVQQSQSEASVSLKCRNWGILDQPISSCPRRHPPRPLTSRSQLCRRQAPPGVPAFPARAYHHKQAKLGQLVSEWPEWPEWFIRWSFSTVWLACTYVRTRNLLVISCCNVITSHRQQAPHTISSRWARVGHDHHCGVELRRQEVTTDDHPCA